MVKTIIVGTVPYNTSGPSRAFESYFHGIDPSFLAQVFSNPSKPKKGHCCTLYQITDSQLLRKWLNKHNKTGTVYNISELNDMDDNYVRPKEKNSLIVRLLQKFGSNHSPTSHLLRKILWRKKLWCTDEFNKWLDDFSPECVFISFSDDFFIHEIAKYISCRFNIPIVFTISDDYIFNNKVSISPLYYIYRSLFKKCVKSTLARSKYGVYICDKIRDKYNSFYSLEGETVYLTSNLFRREYRPIPKNPVIRYFGNIMLDRYKSIIEIAKAVHAINPRIYVEVYSSGITEKVKTQLEKCEAIKLMGFVPYSEVIKLTEESDVILVVEGFSEYNIRSTRYSLSTKAADSLASGVNVFSYGSLECGLIDYLHKYDACMLCTDPHKLELSLREFFSNEMLQRKYYDRAKIVYEMNHNIEVSSSVAREMIKRAVMSWKQS